MNETSRTPSWAIALDRVRWIGPGMAMAATAIGASHLVLAPTAGATYGYALLWVMPFSHLFKYPAFEFGPRFAVATGGSLLDGYAAVAGPRNWALWIFLAGTVVQGVTVLAGVLGVSAAVVAAALPPGAPIPFISLALGLLCAGLLRSGGFDGLSALSKWLLLGLSAMTLVAFISRPPSGEFWHGLVVPEIPAGSLLLIGALLGWMPTGVDVSVWHSLWALQRKSVWESTAERKGSGGTLGTFRIGLADMRVGYGLSFVLSIIFVSLGAEVLRPTGEIPTGAGVAITIARLYTEVLGSWVYPLFLAAAFFGMFSTAYGVLDGFPRAFRETMRRLRAEAATHLSGESRGGHRLYWAFLLASLALAFVETLIIPDPVVLVTIAAVASFLIAPVLYALNYACVTRLIEDPALRPGRALRVWAVVGIACMLGATGLFLYLQIRG
ncbi:MAG: divalent metal cation transporter [Gemmatimonadales bacterium]|jgi:Mn2+/Fe2+ NRAMP family transporter